MNEEVEENLYLNRKKSFSFTQRTQILQYFQYNVRPSIYERTRILCWKSPLLFTQIFYKDNNHDQ